MGWSSGSRLFSDIAEVIADNVADEEDRLVIYETMVSAFIDRDCDTLSECMGIDHVLDGVLRESLDMDDVLEDQDGGWPYESTEDED